MMLSDVSHLSVAYIGPESRTERPRKTKIGTEVADVTRDSDTTFKVKRSKVKVIRPLYSPRRLRIRQLQWWPWERTHRRNVLLRCGLQARQREALRRPQTEERGGAYRVATRTASCLWFWSPRAFVKLLKLRVIKLPVCCSSLFRCCWVRRD